MPQVIAAFSALSSKYDTLKCDTRIMYKLKHISAKYTGNAQ